MVFKKAISMLVSGALIFGVVSGVVVPSTVNPISSDAATTSVYDFDYGSGISWEKDEPLPTFSEIKATKDNKMDIFVANNTMGKTSTTVFSNTDRSVKYAMVSLQGIVNRTSPRIIIQDSQEEGQDTWPAALVGSTKLSKTTDYISLIKKYKSEIKGLVVYNDDIPATMNIATSIAGADSLLACNTSLANELISKCGLSIKVNLKNVSSITDALTAYDYLYEKYYATGKLNKRLIFTLNPEQHFPTNRDLAVALKSVVIWFPHENGQDFTREEYQRLDLFFNEATPGVTYNMGFWPSEDQGVTYTTKKGAPLIPSDWFENMTVYMATSKVLDIPEVPEKPKLENKIYVALSMSDGDNACFSEHKLKNYWSDKNRQLYPISFTSTPALYWCAPQMLNYYYKTAGNSSFICGPSGLGYTRATRWRENSESTSFLDKYVKATDNAFEKTGFSVLTIWDRISESCYKDFAMRTKTVIGCAVMNNTFNDYDTNNPDSMFINGQWQSYPLNGSIAYKSNVPIIGLGWPYGYAGGANAYKDIRNNLEEIAKNFNGTKPEFRFCHFVNWDNPPTIITKHVAQYLDKAYPDTFEFVRADHFFMLANEYNNKPYNLALQKDAKSSYLDDQNADANVANDGTIATGWSDSQSKTKYYQIDLGARSSITKYVLKNAGSYNMDSKLNTAGYYIDYSIDGTNWKRLDTVTNNTKDILYRDTSLLQVTDARYVRVTVTHPGADGIARIQDLEIYGNRTVATKDELQSLYSELNSRPQGTTSTQNWQAFKQALNNVNTVISNANSTSEQIEAAYSALLVAKNGLNDIPAIAINNVPASVLVELNKRITIDAQLAPVDTTDTITEWTSADKKVATVQNGIITGVGVGETTITVKTNRGLTKTIKVTVKVPVKSVSINKTSLTLNYSMDYTLVATINPAEPTNPELKWTSSNENVILVDESGWIYANGYGTATVTVASVDDPSKKATCKITVPAPVSSVKASAKKVTLNKGKTKTITVTINPSNAYNKSPIKWTTANKNVATVNSKGKIKGVYGGITTVTITAGGKKAKITVYVNGLSKGNKAYYKNGKKLKKKWVKVSKKWYYVDAKGNVVKNKSIKIKGKTYKFNTKGICKNKK